MSKAIEYKTFETKYNYNSDFDEDKWLNSLGVEGWVLIGETHTEFYSTGERVVSGTFWRKK